VAERPATLSTSAIIHNRSMSNYGRRVGVSTVSVASVALYFASWPRGPMSLMSRPSTTYGCQDPGHSNSSTDSVAWSVCRNVTAEVAV